ncbi:MAG TPA: hypothetical protein VLV76_01975 [Candidatus Acidoferrum sp.]|nr:hypothetical protein [Candidatus Acidoferrum sp.]
MRRIFRLAAALLLLLAIGVAALAGAAYRSYHRDLPLQRQRGPVGLWLEHRWVGEPQTDGAYDALADELHGLGVTDVFAHVGPVRLALAGADPAAGRPGVAIYARWTTDAVEWATDGCGAASPEANIATAALRFWSGCAN